MQYEKQTLYIMKTFRADDVQCYNLTGDEKQTCIKNVTMLLTCEKQLDVVSKYKLYWSQVSDDWIAHKIPLKQTIINICNKSLKNNTKPIIVCPDNKLVSNDMLTCDQLSRIPGRIPYYRDIFCIGKYSDHIEYNFFVIASMISNNC